MDDVYGESEGTVVPGTPYEVITVAALHEDRVRDVGPSELFDVNPAHKQWICQAMLGNWGIYSSHPWQIRAIHDITFNCDCLVYLIAKTGSSKSAIPLTVGSLQWGVTLSIILLVGQGSNQVSKTHNDDC
jgi:hypothetical protein